MCIQPDLISVHGDIACATAITGKHPKLIKEKKQESYETAHVHISTYCGFAFTEVVDVNNSGKFYQTITGALSQTSPIDRRYFKLAMYSHKLNHNLIRLHQVCCREAVHPASLSSLGKRCRGIPGVSNGFSR